MQQLLILLLLIPFIGMEPATGPATSPPVETTFSKQNQPSLPGCKNAPVPTTAVNVHIVNLRSRGGHVCIAVFDGDESFRKEKPLKTIKLKHTLHHPDTLTVLIELVPGTYGISVLDDTDSDGRMKYGFAGIPLEGFGFSGYRQKGLKRPRFSDFSFGHRSTTQVEVRMYYLH
jgi:uncharacterized protein (DUF2141 family)